MKLLNYFNKQELDNKKILLIISISIFIIFLDIAVLLNLQLKMIRGGSLKIRKLRSDMALLNQGVTKMQQEGGQKDTAKVKVKKIISEDQISSLLQDIYSIARRHKLYINLMQPVKPTGESKAVKKTVPIPPKPAAAKTAAGKTAARRPAQPEQPVLFKSILFSMDILGDYHAFGAFINDLENGEECMAIDALKITPNPNNEFQQKAYIVLKVYVKN
jgi:Tfp pilus assembly protein PilO